MDIQLQSIHFDADQKLVRFIKERLSKLNLFYDQIIGSEVFLRLDKSDKNLNKIVEIKLNIPGKELFAADLYSAGRGFESLHRLIKSSLHN